MTTFNTFQDWQQTITAAYPQCVLVTRSEKIRNKVTKTVSAEQRNGDECFGVWYQDSQEGIIFDENIKAVTVNESKVADISVSILVFVLEAFAAVTKGIMIAFVGYLAAESVRNSKVYKNLTK